MVVSRRAAPRPATKPVTETVASGCQLTELFSLMGKAHMLDIIHYFQEQSKGPVRFVTLQRALDLSPNTLSDRLRQLVAAGLLTRTSYPEIPPRVDYQATPKAHDLRIVFEHLTQWSEKHDLSPWDA